jgi:hypothetical protein
VSATGNVCGLWEFGLVTLRPGPQTQQLYCKVCLMSALLGVAFGHRDLQTSLHQTSLCGHFSKKDFTWVTYGTWRKRITVLNTLLPTLDPETVLNTLLPTLDPETQCWTHFRRHWTQKHSVEHTVADTGPRNTVLNTLLQTLDPETRCWTHCCRHWTQKQWTHCCQHWTQKHSVEHTVADTEPRNTSWGRTKHFNNGGHLSLRSWCAFLTSALKLFCKFFLTNTN